MEWDARRIIESELNRSTIFKNPESLAPEYVPDMMPHREGELRALTSYFRHLLEGSSLSQRVLVAGRIGTGKTTLARVFATNFARIAGERGLRLSYVHVNCYRNRTLFSVINDIALQLGIPAPSRGLSSKELLDLILDALEERDQYLIAILDDFHYFASIAGRDAVYFIARIYDSNSEWRRLNLILVSSDTALPLLLDPITESYLQRHVIRLSPYTSAQLLDILRYRARLAFHENTYDEEALEYIAEYEGVDRNGEGNARHALTILFTAADIAEKEGAGRLTVEYVRKAITRLSREVVSISDTIRYSPLHELLLLLSIIRVLRRKNAKEAEMGEVEEEYELVCNTYGEIPRKHTRLYEYLRSLSKSGIVALSVGKAGNRGRTTRISLHYGPLEDLEKYVDALIRRRKESNE